MFFRQLYALFLFLFLRARRLRRRDVRQLRRLAREYDVKIELCTDAFDDKTFRISITEAQDIESIMGGLCDILPISVRRDTCGYRVDSRPRKTEP